MLASWKAALSWFQQASNGALASLAHEPTSARRGLRSSVVERGSAASGPGAALCRRLAFYLFQR